jgi:uncharacterized OB-fold protein
MAQESAAARAVQPPAVPTKAPVYEVVDGRPHLLGTKCSACGAAFFPPRFVCPTCLTEEHMLSCRLGNTGTLYAHTVISVAPKEFKPPYPFGYIIVQPEKVRIPAMITGITDYKSLRAGMKMEMVLEKLRDDPAAGEIITYKFRPVADK